MVKKEFLGTNIIGYNYSSFKALFEMKLFAMVKLLYIHDVVPLIVLINISILLY